MLSPYFFKIFRFMKPYSIRYAITQIIYSAQGFALPFIISVFTANVLAAIVAGERDAVFAAAVTLAVMIGTYLAVLVAGVYVNMLTIERAGMDIRRAMFRTFMRTGLEDATHSGEGIAAMNTDVDTAQNIFNDAMFQLLYSVIGIIGASVVVFAVQWRLGVAMVVVGIVSFFMQHRFTKPLARVGTETLEANADALKDAGGIFAGAMTIRTYNMQPQAYLAFDAKSKRLRTLNIRHGMIRMGQRLFGTVEGWLTLAVTFGFGGWLVANGTMPFYQLASIYIMASTLTSSIGSLGQNYAGLQPAIAGAERVFKVLERDVPAALPSSAGFSAADGYVIEVENLTFQYRDAAAPALRNISLEIPENQFIAFVGESGSGKSTLLKTLVGLYHRDDLNMTFGGRAFAETSLKDWRNQFAYVDQSGKLFDMTIRENIALGCIDRAATESSAALDEEIHNAARAAAIHDFIESLEQGYDTPCGENGAALSGGQRARIAIARALMKNARILVFDEATAALDPDTEAQILETIETLRGQYTILMATHNLDSTKTADRVVRLAAGADCS